MTINPVSVAYPFTCPDCEIEATVVIVKAHPQLLKERSCRHAVSVQREGSRLFVQFIPQGE